MTERTKTIKGLISGQVDMGTFGLVELELIAIENEMEALRKQAVSSSVCPCNELPDGEIAISSKALQKTYGDLGKTDC